VDSVLRMIGKKRLLKPVKRKCLDQCSFPAYTPASRYVPGSMTRPTILCVDDYETSLGGWCLYLQFAGYSVVTARTGQEALQVFAVSPVDLVLLDYAMPDSNGDDVAAMMKRIKPDVRILMFSGVPEVPESARLNVDAFLQKGQSPIVVLDKIQELLESSPRAA
jgi:CheY-like chemotaxis protein